ncbi:unnamed protein product [Caenorhabditis auriculariae]|uniref:Uncharacterized protein n=1 Tax=Caenorhabditis auriculariae TaxID=2777116 RepID=A0A8S1GQD0_9PELO|nr:unnamed protein product [Caenorhabditis auriculariae]
MVDNRQECYYGVTVVYFTLCHQQSRNLLEPFRSEMYRPIYHFRPEEPKCCMIPARGLLIVLAILTMGAVSIGYASGSILINLAGLIFVLVLGVLAIAGTIHNSPAALLVVLVVFWIDLIMTCVFLLTVPIYVASAVGSGHHRNVTTAFSRPYYIPYEKTAEEHFAAALTAGYTLQFFAFILLTIALFKVMLVKRVHSFARHSIDIAA